MLEENGDISVLESGTNPSVKQKLAFAEACLRKQVSREISAIVFDQVGIAQVQNLLPSIFRLPYAVFVYGVDVWHPLNAFERRALLNATGVLCISHFTYQKALAVNAWFPKAVVVPLCLPPDYKPSELRNVSFRPVALTVGRLDETYKGHDEILNIWPEVLKYVPDAVYWVVGTGKYLPRLQLKVRTLGIEDSVKFWGFVSDETLADLYAQCAVFAMPSYGEGFGLVYLEAMRHRKPCIGSIHDAAKEVIVHNQTGFLVDQSNPAELLQMLLKLLQHPEICARLGEMGYQRERQVFSYQHFRKRVKEALMPLWKS